MSTSMTRDRLTALLVVAALLTLTVAATRFVLSESDASDDVPQVAEWQSLVKAGNVIGPRDADLSIVFFADYECEVCAVMHQQLTDFRELHGRAVSVVVRYYPLQSVHRYARAAAVAAECSAIQGRFSAMNDVLYQNQTSFGSVTWSELAKLAGVMDLAAFDACTEGADTAERVEADRQLAIELRLRGTPALVVEGRLFYGSDALEFAEGILTARADN